MRREGGEATPRPISPPHLGPHWRRSHHSPRGSDAHCSRYMALRLARRVGDTWARALAGRGGGPAPRLRCDSASCCAAPPHSDEPPPPPPPPPPPLLPPPAPTDGGGPAPDQRRRRGPVASSCWCSAAAKRIKRCYLGSLARSGALPDPGPASLGRRHAAASMTTAWSGLQARRMAWSWPDSSRALHGRMTLQPCLEPPVSARSRTPGPSESDSEALP